MNISYSYFVTVSLPTLESLQKAKTWTSQFTEQLMNSKGSGGYSGFNWKFPHHGEISTYCVVIVVILGIRWLAFWLYFFPSWCWERPAFFINQKAEIKLSHSSYGDNMWIFQRNAGTLKDRVKGSCKQVHNLSKFAIFTQSSTRSLPKLKFRHFFLSI